MRAINKTFQGGDPTWANACVGNNGSPGVYDYGTGFALAAKQLVDWVLDRENAGKVDLVIYPICFNMRHATELFLKSCAEWIQKIGRLRGVNLPHFDLVSTHDLRLLWGYLRQHAESVDLRYREHLTMLEEYVLDIGAVDATGQVFRYPFSVSNQKHLTELSVINVRFLGERFEALQAMLAGLDRLNRDLDDEYRCGTFTRHLSRAQLIEVATALPPRYAWKEESFEGTRAAVCKKYGISRRELTAALNHIQKRHEIAALIGIVVEIPNLKSEALETFFAQWSSLHGFEDLKRPREPRIREISWPGDIDFAATRGYFHTKYTARDVIVSSVSPQRFAPIRALYYFERDMQFSETFDSYLEDYRKEAVAHEQHRNRYEAAVEHLLEKTDAVKAVISSLHFLRQTSHLGVLLRRFDLEPFAATLMEDAEMRLEALGLGTQGSRPT